MQPSIMKNEFLRVYLFNLTRLRVANNGYTHNRRFCCNLANNVYDSVLQLRCHRRPISLAAIS